MTSSVPYHSPIRQAGITHPTLNIRSLRCTKVSGNLKGQWQSLNQLQTGVWKPRLALLEVSAGRGGLRERRGALGFRCGYRKCGLQGSVARNGPTHRSCWWSGTPGQPSGQSGQLHPPSQLVGAKGFSVSLLPPPESALWHCPGMSWASRPGSEEVLADCPGNAAVFTQAKSQ